MATRNPVPFISPVLTAKVQLAFPAIAVQEQLEAAYVEPVKVDFRNLADIQGEGFTYDLAGIGSVRVAIGAPPGETTKVIVNPDLTQFEIDRAVKQGILIRETKRTTGRLGAVTFTPNK